jgi:ATP-dependent Clp protease, protease subunit
MSFIMSDTKPDSEKPNEKPDTETPGKLLFDARVVTIFGEINHEMAKATCERLLALAQKSRDPIRILVSSPGGHVESGDAIHDMVQFIDVPVTMIGSGWVASAGTHIYLSVPKEKRVCLPNTRFLIHQPSGGAMGSSSDIEIQMREIVKTRQRLAKVISAATGQSIDRVTKDFDRDYWMDTSEAIEYGIVSRVVKRSSEI